MYFMVTVTSETKKEMFAFLGENPTATLKDFKEKYGLNASQSLKYYTEYQEISNGNIEFGQGRKPKPKDDIAEDEEELEDEEDGDNRAVELPDKPPIKEFLQKGKVEKQTDDDEGIQCGNCGFVMPKLPKFCPNCGVEFE